MADVGRAVEQRAGRARCHEQPQRARSPAARAAKRDQFEQQRRGQYDQQEPIDVFARRPVKRQAEDKYPGIDAQGDAREPAGRR